MDLNSRRKIFYKNVFRLDLINKLHLTSTHGFPDFSKVVLSFNIADLKDEKNIMFYEALEILSFITYQKAHVSKFHVKRRGPRVYLNFVAKVTLRGQKNYYFIDFFLDYLLHYWYANYFLIANGVDSFGNYNCAMSDISYIPGLLKIFQYGNWRHPIHFSFSIKVQKRIDLPIYCILLYKTFGFKLKYLV